jgi:hypothetical protein
MMRANITPGRRIIAVQVADGMMPGTEGIVVKDHGSWFMVAWDTPQRPLPKLPPDLIARMKVGDPRTPYTGRIDKESELDTVMEADA